MGTIVRSLGYCEHCGKRNVRLEWVHIKSRRYLSTRWVMENCMCLCSSCHRWFHNNPDLFVRWINQKWPDRIDKLNEIFKDKVKLTLQDRLAIEVDLKEKIRGGNEALGSKCNQL